MKFNFKLLVFPSIIKHNCDFSDTNRCLLPDRNTKEMLFFIVYDVIHIHPA